MHANNSHLHVHISVKTSTLCMFTHSVCIDVKISTCTRPIYICNHKITVYVQVASSCIYAIHIYPFHIYRLWNHMSHTIHKRVDTYNSEVHVILVGIFLCVVFQYLYVGQHLSHTFVWIINKANMLYLWIHTRHRNESSFPFAGLGIWYMYKRLISGNTE